jgi:hypothetical protein
MTIMKKCFDPRPPLPNLGPFRRQRLSSLPSRPHIGGEMPQVSTSTRAAAAGDGRPSPPGQPRRPASVLAAAPSYGARESTLECRVDAFAASRSISVAKQRRDLSNRPKGPLRLYSTDANQGRRLGHILGQFSTGRQ